MFVVLSRREGAMETPSSPRCVIIAYDANKVRNEHEFEVTINHAQARGDILRGGDTILVLGVLHKGAHPMGYHVELTESFAGIISTRATEEEVSKRVDAYANMLLPIAEKCEDEGLNIEVKITAGAPVKQVILQEAIASKANWVILDRHFRRDFRFYYKHLPCKVAIIQDSLSVDVQRSIKSTEVIAIEQKLFYSMSKHISSMASQGSENKSHFPKSSEKLPSDSDLYNFEPFLMNNTTGEQSLSVFQNSQKKNVFRGRTSEAPILCATCGTRAEVFLKDSMSFTVAEIQKATSNFSKENLVGEGGYGYVYKGKLRDGRLVAAKVRKEGSAQGFEQFHSEIYVLSFARHKNIVMLLGYCCKENLNVLVYEYICNSSLYWHLFDETAAVLEWHRRYAIAVGTAKGLRFLHEECRGGPIIHRDMRPSNILLTHDFVPMLGDFGLARWKTSEDVQTRILGTLGYLAPEYAECGTVSIRTDVYAFGVVLLQLISGRKAIDLKRNEPDQSLRQWAEHLIEKMELHELIDPRIGDSYDTYELYLMSRAAYQCINRSPEMRPSMGEVVRLLEGKKDGFNFQPLS